MKTMTRYRARPVELEAIQWTGDNFHEVRLFAGNDVEIVDGENLILSVDTSEGLTIANRGHYIVRDDRGKHYPCDQGVFERKYEPID